jgi:cation transporter-like permease
VSPKREKRLMISAVLYPVVQAVLFGGAVVVIATGFAEAAGTLIPYAVLASLILAAPLSWDIAPALSLELQGKDRLSRFRAGKR